MTRAIRLSPPLLDLLMFLALAAGAAISAHNLAELVQMHAAAMSVCGAPEPTLACRLLCWIAGAPR